MLLLDFALVLPLNMSYLDLMKLDVSLLKLLDIDLVLMELLDLALMRLLNLALVLLRFNLLRSVVELGRKEALGATRHGPVCEEQAPQSRSNVIV